MWPDVVADDGLERLVRRAFPLRDGKGWPTSGVGESIWRYFVRSVSHSRRRPGEFVHDAARRICDATCDHFFSNVPSAGRPYEQLRARYFAESPPTLSRVSKELSFVPGEPSAVPSFMRYVRLGPARLGLVDLETGEIHPSGVDR